MPEPLQRFDSITSTRNLGFEVYDGDLAMAEHVEAVNQLTQSATKDKR